MIDYTALPTLGPRLETIIKAVSPGHTVADIGTDHALVPIYLVKSGICPGAIAMDVAKGPLERARSNIKAYGLDDKIQTGLSDGLKELKKGQADTIIIAGMGGHLMCRILRESYETFLSAKELILSPQSDIDLVRSLLWESSKVIEETMVQEEGKYYTVIKYAVSEREEPYSKEELLFGRLLIKNRDEVFLDYLVKTKEVLRQNIANIQNHSKDGEKRINYLEDKLKQIEDILGNA